MILVADIGGTKTRIAVVNKEIQDRVVLPTSQKAINELVIIAKKYKVSEIGIGAAGPHIGDTIKLTNAKVIISKKAIEEKTGAKVTLFNDLEALGYSLKTNIKKRCLKKGSGKGAKAIISVGTGLGKTIVCTHCQKPLPSEVSKTLIPITSAKELQLIEKIAKNPMYEDMLSSRGIVNLYAKLQSKYNVQKNPTMHEITKMNDPCKKATYTLFAKILARLAKQTILDNFAIGGIYLAGGILKHNQKEYIAKFIKEMSDKNPLISKTPIWILEDENATLEGIAYELHRKKKKH
jgi:glucokinase